MLNEMAIYMCTICARFRGQRFASNSMRLFNTETLLGPELEELSLARTTYQHLLLTTNPDRFFGPAILGDNAMPPVINP